MNYCILVVLLLMTNAVDAYSIKNPSLQNPVPALIIAPVVDLVTQSLTAQFPTQSAAQSYNNLPICWGPEKKDIAICPRIHQALFNEVVEVIGENSNEYQIKISSAFFDNQTNQEPQSTYWMLKGNVIALSELYSKKRSRSAVPKPVSYNTGIVYDKQTATLILPFYDLVTQFTFSAGTRFVVSADQVYPQLVTVYIFNPKSGDITTTNIPKKLCTLSSESLSRKDAQNRMVQLLRSWTHLSSGVIPLVWGGTSFTQTVIAKDFLLKHVALNGLLLAYWQRSPLVKTPFAGFDASGLICRAAQIYNIPYYFKNSTTAAAHLRPLYAYEPIEEGDIIVVPGGILIVSSTAPNNQSVISSCSYSSGYGCVVEIKLEDLFENITTFGQLLGAYNTKQQLRVKNAEGNYSRTYDSFSIHKFSSVWN